MDGTVLKDFLFCFFLLVSYNGVHPVQGPGAPDEDGFRVTVTAYADMLGR